MSQRDAFRAEQILRDADAAMAARRKIPLPLLERITIASPCHARWADMSGDARVRHCADCDRDVYDLSEMTADEATALLSREGPAACVRLHRRADGTVITSDCPVGRSQKRRRNLVAAGVAVAGSVLAAAASWMTAHAVDHPPCAVQPTGPTEVVMGAIAVMPPPSTTVVATPTPTSSPSGT